jgi:hypothetical protein
MPTSNNLVAHKKRIMDDSVNYFASANSVRDNLDNVPGGSINAIEILHASITGQPAPASRGFWRYTYASLGSFYYNHIGNTPIWETRVLKPKQCFIPTYSAIGVKNPNQSWAKPLDRNLICSNETYFDSYYGEAKNTPHVKLSYKSVNWLLEELQGKPQPPSFPLPANALSGPEIICTSAVYSFGDICAIPGNATWTKSANLTITSSTKNVWVGIPEFNRLQPVGDQSGYNPLAPSISVGTNGEGCNLISLNVIFDSSSILEYQWEKLTTDVAWSVNANSGSIEISPQCNKDFNFKVRARNACGWSAWQEFVYTMTRCTISCSDTSPDPQQVVGNNFIVSPNPVTSNFLNIGVRPDAPWFIIPVNNDPTSPSTGI